MRIRKVYCPHTRVSVRLAHDASNLAKSHYTRISFQIEYCNVTECHELLRYSPMKIGKFALGCCLRTLASASSPPGLFYSAAEHERERWHWMVGMNDGRELAGRTRLVGGGAVSIFGTASFNLRLARTCFYSHNLRATLCRVFVF